MAMMVEVAQRMLTKRPTVPRISDGVIGFIAKSPSRANEPRTEMMRPKDAVAVRPLIEEFAFRVPVRVDYAVHGLDKLLKAEGISDAVKRAGRNWTVLFHEKCGMDYRALPATAAWLYAILTSSHGCGMMGSSLRRRMASRYLS